MSTTTFNPVSTSGVGFRLEHYVQVAYIASLIVGIPVPFSDILEVTELGFQAKHVVKTDDLLVTLKNAIGQHKHYLQSKKGFEINKNETFEKVIQQAYSDFTGGSFDPSRDKFIVFTDALSKVDADDAIGVLDWARFSKDATDLANKLKLNKAKFNKYVYFKDALNKAAEGAVAADDIRKFLKCFYIKAYDYLAIPSKDQQVLKWFLKPHLSRAITPNDALFRLLNFAEQCNQHGATLNIENVPDDVKALFSADESNKLSGELQELLKKSHSLVSAIENHIDDYHISRDSYFPAIDDAIRHYQIIALTGEGGAGKSGVIKDYLNGVYGSDIGFIALKGDILDKSSLAQSLAEIGVHSDIETLLSQWQHLSNLIIYIDSFEKLYESDYSDAFNELLRKVRERKNITIIVSCRSYAFETLRKKFRIKNEEIFNIIISPLSHEQLVAFAAAKPEISGLLTNPKLQQLLSLPYFLSQAIFLAEMFEDAQTITEREFKKAIWEQVVEKTGHGRLGHSARRGSVFSKLVLKRAIERQAFIGCDESDLEFAEELTADGSLLKHPSQYQYAPKHDVLEDLVVSRDLQARFEVKADTAQFLADIDPNPVIRRGLRIWVQELMLAEPDAGRRFLTESLTIGDASQSLVDELLIGILGSDQAFELMEVNEASLISNHLRLYFKLFNLAKLAYALPQALVDSKRSLITFGPGWNALVKFLGKHYESHKEDFDSLLFDLLQHWKAQFKPQDELPSESEIVAQICLKILNTISSDHFTYKLNDLFEVLFWVVPFAETEIDVFIEEIKNTTVARKSDGGYPVNFVKSVNKLLLKEPESVEKVYQHFPGKIIEIARSEWFSNKNPRLETSHYMEASFGLVDYPYNYFSASAFQTPFLYLFKYHFDIALDFLIEITNRAMAFYKLSDYAKDLASLTIKLDDGQETVQLGNYSLFSGYRGESPVPYLIQSSLMALETVLLERAANGDKLEKDFKKIMLQAETVMLTGVLVSVATAYPFAFGNEIDALFSVREFFSWDLTRISGDYGGRHHSSTIGNDRFYTGERHRSNQLLHRQRHMEMLVTQRQLYFPARINQIIDQHLTEADESDLLWRLALARMDIRNTEPEINEDEQRIEFIPKPLPDDLQKVVDSTAEYNHDTNAISVHLYANKLQKDGQSETPLIDEWRVNYKLLLTIDSSQVRLFYRPDIELATAGLRFFAEQLTEEELEFCLNKIIPELQPIAESAKSAAIRTIEREDGVITRILPVLLSPKCAEKCNIQEVKNTIETILLYGYDEKFSQLLLALRECGWTNDFDFTKQCFQLLLKKSFYTDPNPKPNHYYRMNQYEQKAHAEEFEKAIRDVQDIEVGNIDLGKAEGLKLIQALSAIPLDMLASGYYPFVRALITQLENYPNLESYSETNFRSALEQLLVDHLLSEQNENTVCSAYKLLMLIGNQPNLVARVYELMTAIAHDTDYPLQFWRQLQLVFYYVIKVSPRIMLLKIIFLYSLRHHETARKLSPTPENQMIYETLAKEKGMADKDLATDLFRFLSGVGSTYQPNSLGWLMISFPDTASYTKNLDVKAVAAAEHYVKQVYDEHLNYLRVNKAAMDYYLLMLNALIQMGSREAYRLRDIII